jgi:hypothetical protein
MTRGCSAIRGSESALSRFGNSPMSQPAEPLVLRRMKRKKFFLGDFVPAARSAGTGAPSWDAIRRIVHGAILTPFRISSKRLLHHCR